MWPPKPTRVQARRLCWRALTQGLMSWENLFRHLYLSDMFPSATRWFPSWWCENKQIWQLDIREAPTNQNPRSFGHCPNSNWTTTPSRTQSGTLGHFLGPILPFLRVVKSFSKKVPQTILARDLQGYKALPGVHLLIFLRGFPVIGKNKHRHPLIFLRGFLVSSKVFSETDTFFDTKIFRH